MTADLPVTPEERSVLRAAQAGDEQAFGRLVEPYRRALTIHSYRMLGSRHDAEDIVQETLLRAWRRLGSYEPRAPLASWLYRIATNACLDELQRRPRRPQPVEPFVETQVGELAAPSYDPAARYAMREGLELGLLTAIQQLPGRQRAVLILRDVLGWSAAEVAQTLETSTAAVTSALQRARQTVEQTIPEAPPAPAPAERAERELLSRYVKAFENDDIDELVVILREDATLRMPPQASVVGAVRIARFFRHTVGGGDLSRIRLNPIRANGGPAVRIQLVAADGRLVPHGLSLLEIRGGLIAGIDAFPRALESVRRSAAVDQATHSP
ncbi:MAG: RNA polymerase subunit sigma-70 [Solirubrobacteraceae bacterium]